MGDVAGFVAWMEGEEDFAPGGGEVGLGPPDPLWQEASRADERRNVTIFRMLGERGPREDTLAPVPW